MGNSYMYTFIIISKTKIILNLRWALKRCSVKSNDDDGWAEVGKKNKSVSPRLSRDTCNLDLGTTVNAINWMWASFNVCENGMESSQSKQ